MTGVDYADNYNIVKGQRASKQRWRGKKSSETVTIKQRQVRIFRQPNHTCNGNHIEIPNTRY